MCKIGLAKTTKTLLKPNKEKLNKVYNGSITQTNQRSKSAGSAITNMLY